MNNKTIDYTHTNTLWQFIKKDIEVKIITGVFKNADKVPSISEIAQNYQVGKTTAKKVLETMHSEGTLIKKIGIGYFVKPYMKEQLKIQHMKELELILMNGIELAMKLNIKKQELKVKFATKIEEIYPL